MVLFQIVFVRSLYNSLFSFKKKTLIIFPIFNLCGGALVADSACGVASNTC